LLPNSEIGIADSNQVDALNHALHVFYVSIIYLKRPLTLSLIERKKPAIQERGIKSYSKCQLKSELNSDYQKKCCGVASTDLNAYHPIAK
jgi:hypothetical protein